MAPAPLCSAQRAGGHGAQLAACAFTVSAGGGALTMHACAAAPGDQRRRAYALLRVQQAAARSRAAPLKFGGGARTRCCPRRRRAYASLRTHQAAARSRAADLGV
ncbi:hypothetical protein JKP88DRAFT_250414 [Tribonema minus]|uniref:Uncharacterized protein n=1 Tax=Tribonema minus TaxID=303371 RepID=A0A835YGG9_9STRA|nr:hypothetical protein JKP88DRAFT_250414 [Tribonema minus]